jgi:hypothetical protein
MSSLSRPHTQTSTAHVATDHFSHNILARFAEIMFRAPEVSPLASTFASLFSRLDRLVNSLPEGSMHFVKALPDFGSRLGKYKVLLLSHATLHCTQHQLVQIDISLQRLLEQRKQENLTLKSTLNRQGTDLVRADKTGIVVSGRDDLLVWRKKLDARTSTKGQIESEIDQLEVDNQELEAAISGRPSAPPGSAVRNFRVQKRGLDR